MGPHATRSDQESSLRLTGTSIPITDERFDLALTLLLAHLVEDVTHDRSVEAPDPDHSPCTQFATRRCSNLSLSSFISSLSLHEIFRSWHAGRQARRQISGLDRRAHFFPRRGLLTLISCTRSHSSSLQIMRRRSRARSERIRIGGSGRRRALCPPNGRPPRGTPFARGRSSSSGGRGRCRGSHSSVSFPLLETGESVAFLLPSLCPARRVLSSPLSSLLSPAAAAAAAGDRSVCPVRPGLVLQCADLNPHLRPTLLVAALALSLYMIRLS